MSQVRRLLIATHVAHYCDGDSIYAYGPYAREVDLWCDLFDEVVIAAPCRPAPIPADCLRLNRNNVRTFPLPETGGRTFKAKALQVLALPRLCLALARAMRRADAIHVRCPGNIGLLGVLLGPLFSRFLVAKFAGQWNGYPREPRSVRAQRWLLGSRWWRGPVTVYGEWPGQPDHVVSFFTSILSESQLDRARQAALQQRPTDCLRILYVGRLSVSKNVNALIKATASLRSQGVPIECDVVGAGPEAENLARQASELGVSDRVRFHGGLELEQVLDFYEQAHVLVLLSETEGWPKAIAEAMAFGVVCIGSNRGFVPRMLADGRGLIAPPGDAHALAEILARLHEHPEEMQQISSRAAPWGQGHSMEQLRESLRELLSQRWGVSLKSSPMEPAPVLAGEA